MIARILLMIRRGCKAFHSRGWIGLAEIIHRNLHRLVPCTKKKILPCPSEEHNPQEIYCDIDFPKTENWETDSIMPLIGWTWSKYGIESVGVLVDNELAAFTIPTIERPDIAKEYPEFKNNAPLGFAESLNFANHPYADYGAKIVVCDKKKNVRILDKIIRRVQEPEAYHKYYFASLLKTELLYRENPVDNEHIRVWLICGSEDSEAVYSTIKSICAQSYDNWDCIIIIGRSKQEFPDLTIPAAPSLSPRFSFSAEINLDDSPTFHANLLCFLQAGEILAPPCFWEFVHSSQVRPQPEVIYSDSDCVDDGGSHCNHHFKPDWSRDYLWADNYIGGFYMIRETVIADIDKKLVCDSPAWRYKFLLRLVQNNTVVRHIAKLLWSAPLSQTADKVLIDAEFRAAGDIIAEQRPESPIVPIKNSRIREINWSIKAPPPKVSIIIPTTGKSDLIKPCVDSLVDKTNYQNYEIVFIDNGRGANLDGIKYLQDNGFKIIECREPFNWPRLNNLGVKETDGELLLFLNDDVEAIDSTWLSKMVAQALRAEVGTVGALLLYPDRSIQHAGIFLVDHGGGARHYFHGLFPGSSIYQELHHVAREVTACTGACLMVRRNVFEELGGFDEELAIVGNDVDFCLRAIEAGYKNIFTPHCRMVHHESVSRKKTNIDADENKMWKRWRDKFMAGDPYYNRNLAQDMMDHSLDMSILFEPFPRETNVISAYLRKRGVNIIGYIKSEMGVGEAARGLAKAIQFGGVPFAIIDYEFNNPSRKNDTTWAHRLTDAPVFNINIFHINADVLPIAREQLGANFFDDHYNIAFWAWELPEFPDIWQSSFDMVNEIWAPSTFVQEAIAQKSPLPVYCFPHPVTKEVEPYLERRYFGIPDNAFLFLSMYDLWSIRKRKNPQGSIMAFKRAFAPDDFSTGLVLKVNNADESELNVLKGLIGDYKNIYIIDRILSRFEVDSLVSNCDCFVSLHRSEGFGLVMAEAMAMGRPVIATGWSGNMEFMDDSNSACVKYELIQLDRDYGPYKKNQYWAEPDINNASWWMKKFVADPLNAKKVGLRGQHDVNRKLSPLAIGNNIKKRLDIIAGIA